MIPLEYMDDIIWEKIDTEYVKPYMERTIGDVLKEYEMTGKLRIPKPKDNFDGNDFVKTMCKEGADWYQKSLFESF